MMQYQQRQPAILFGCVLLLVVHFISLRVVRAEGYLDYLDPYNLGGNYSYNDPTYWDPAWSTKHESDVEYNIDYGNDAYMPVNINPDFIWPNCIEHEIPGKPVDEAVEILINGTRACDLVVQGTDKHADLLIGGVDGYYKMSGCENGKPVYVRHPETEQHQRMLQFTPETGLWEFLLVTQGDDATMNAEAIMYGSYGQVSPLDVEEWHLATDLNRKESEAFMDPLGVNSLFYAVKDVSVTCAEEKQGDSLLNTDQNHHVEL